MNFASGLARVWSALFLPLMGLGCLAFAGCPARIPLEDVPAAPVKPLRLWVVGQPAVAEAIEREWASRSGDQLTVEQVPADQFLTRQQIPADAVIFPANALAMLAERDLLLPLDDSFLNAPEIDRPDLSLQARDRRGVWGRKTLALSFGESPLVLVYNRNAFELLGVGPPQTWDELHKLFANYPPQELHAQLPALGLVQPSSPGWNARLLLARSAAYLAQRESSRTFIEYDTLRPLINSPPVVRALEQICQETAVQGAAGIDYPQLTPEDCFWLVGDWQGCRGDCTPAAYEQQ
jgi:hypothetical protein